jgi:hypothetical protein
VTSSNSAPPGGTGPDEAEPIIDIAGSNQTVDPAVEPPLHLIVVDAAGQAGGNEEPAHVGERSPGELVEQPTKVMRIGSMVKQLLEEVRGGTLDEASRARLRDIHERSIAELQTALAPELMSELSRMALPFTADEIPSEGELRIVQAQLVGWLEGLFHGIQAALFAQQMTARALAQGVSPRAIMGAVSEAGQAGGDGPAAEANISEQRGTSSPYL